MKYLKHIKNNIKNEVHKIFAFTLSAASFLPQVTFADGGCSKSFSDVSGILDYAACIISASVIPLLYSLAILAFLWGVVNFIFKANDKAQRENGRQFMIWSIIAFFVLTSFIGLASVVSNTFGLEPGGVISAPQLQTQ